MKAGLVDIKAFPYTTKNPELGDEIKVLLKQEETPLTERVAKLSPAGQGNFGGR